ncbi:MAG TPA: 50S ribosomal protein L4 [Lentisphaeria bacterium]|nr:MAG: 50S ribosomal protein L4 [Lentisphaerae bacterium GWF2_49_21]HBC85332.1 50S ribosomal protein L4 [Lentisphaeria bacterium]
MAKTKKIKSDVKKELSVKIIDNNGSAAGDLTLKPKHFELEKGAQAVHDSVVAHLAEKRAGTASTKDRSEVSGGGAKPWRQKGTGRARVGSNRSPIWRHGGITFGPKPRKYGMKVNRKVLALALKRAFSEKIADGTLVMAESFKIDAPKTKNVASLLDKMKLGENVLLVLKEIDKDLVRASQNMPNVMLVKADSVNTYQLLLTHKILFTKDAMDVFLKRLE